MSVLGVITGQVWFLVGTCIFVASAISVTILPFSVLRNAKHNRGEIDQGTATRLDALQTMSMFYILGGAFGTMTALVIRLIFSPTQATWSAAGLVYLLLAGLATAYLVKAIKGIAINEEQMPQAPAPAPAPAPASMPIDGARPSSGVMSVQDRVAVGYIASRLDHEETVSAEATRAIRATRVGLVFGYVAAVIVVITAVILMGVV